MALAVPAGYLLGNPVPFGGTIPGTLLKPGRTIAPTSYGDTYPQAFDVLISGGWVNVADADERVALPASTIKEGKMCWQADNKHLYQMQADLVTWQDLGLFAGAAAQSVFKGNWNGGTPDVTPTGDAAIAYDLDAPRNVWYWDGSAWT